MAHFFLSYLIKCQWQRRNTVGAVLLSYLERKEPLKRAIDCKCGKFDCNSSDSIVGEFNMKFLKIFVNKRTSKKMKIEFYD